MSCRYLYRFDRITRGWCDHHVRDRGQRQHRRLLQRIKHIDREGHLHRDQEDQHPGRYHRQHHDGVRRPADCQLGLDRHLRHREDLGRFYLDDPVTEDVTMASSNPASCTVTATGTLSTNSGTMLVALKYDPATTSSPTPPPPSGPVRLYKGIGGKCVDDAGNSSANRAKVVIWTCNSHDRAQGWTYSGGKLIHNGKCLNDQRSGGNGSKVILYTCNGGANEIWTHKSNGEFVLKANGGKYCLDDPASSTHNGTQLIVWAGKNTTNQHWFASTVS